MKILIIISCAITSLFFVTLASAAPRMISYKYPNCMSCHISIQGQGLLNPYGEAIDVAQSYLGESESGFLDYIKNLDLESDSTIQDIRSSFKENIDLEDGGKSSSFEAVYRNVHFFSQENMIRSNLEVAYADGETADTLVGGYFIREGQDRLNLRKMTMEWRFRNNGDEGVELVVGRDYLPQGLQVGPMTSYYRLLNRAGRDDFPTQVKLFKWNTNYLATAYVFGPSGEEGSDNKEWGAGGFYERYLLENRLALGVQGLTATSDAIDRTKVGLYARYGFTQSLGILAEVDYAKVDLNGFTSFGGSDIDQVTSYTRLYYFATEWLIPSATFEYAYLSNYVDPHFTKAKLSLDARISRNFSLGIDYSFGDTSTALQSGEQIMLRVSFKP